MRDQNLTEFKFYNFDINTPRYRLTTLDYTTTMNKSMMIRRLISAPPALRSSLLQRRLFSPQSRQYAVQSITQASFWTNMIPKPFRKSERAVSKKPKSKDWNPATFFIWIFLLIGSMSIQMIALRNEYSTFSRRADAKIGVLREIIQRIRNGEKPDVEALLGVGDQEQEREWEEGIFAMHHFILEALF